MTTNRARREIVGLAVLIVVSTCLGIGVSLGGFLSQHSQTQQDRKLLVSQGRTLAVAVKNGEETRDQASRTECARQRSASLDKARWDGVWDLFLNPDTKTAARIAAAKKALPKIDALVDNGGKVDGHMYPPCSASIAPPRTRPASSTTTTPRA